MDRRIIDFLKKQTSASVSCVNEMQEPYSFSCFFAFNPEQNLLYYKSAPSSYHSQVLSKQPKVAGTIMPDKLNKLAIRGIQFTGDLLAEDDPLCKNAAEIYYTKFPIGLAIPGNVYTIRLDQLKMTNNVLGMMEKLSWQRDELLTVNEDDLH